MANAILGHSFGVLPRRKRFDNLQSTDTQKLGESLGIIREEPKQISVRPEAERKEKEQEQAAKVRIQETIDKFKEILKAGEQMKILLRKKLGNRTIRVNAAENPAVRDAIRRVFGIDSDIITYDMFEKALETRSELSKEGRSLYVTYDTKA